MLKSGFVVAMAAKFSFSAYDRPVSELRTLALWIVVSRCGPNSELVTVANAQGRVGPDADAPIGLSPIKTAVGILASESAEESTFLLVRQRPVQIPIAGTFFPADGYVRIVKIGGVLGLRADGRHAHSVGRVGGRWIRNDVPDPAPNTRGAMAWHIDAVRRKWVGEFIG
jgi:hypothetical protein